MSKKAWINGIIFSVILWTIVIFGVKLAFSDGTIVIKPVHPGTDIEDFSKPSLIINPDGSSYYTRPGTRIRDFKRGGYHEDKTPKKNSWSIDQYDQIERIKLK